MPNSNRKNNKKKLPLSSGVQASGTGQDPAKSEKNSSLPSGVQASDGNPSSVTVNDDWLCNGDDLAIQVPIVSEQPDLFTRHEFFQPVIKTTHTNFNSHPFDRSEPAIVYCDPTAVLAVVAIIDNFNLQKPVPSSVKRGGLLQNKILMSCTYQTVIISVMGYGDLDLSTEQKNRLFRMMCVSPKETVSFAQIIGLIETPLVLSKETVNLIRFPPISAKKDDDAIAAAAVADAAAAADGNPADAASAADAAAVAAVAVAAFAAFAVAAS